MKNLLSSVLCLQMLSGNICVSSSLTNVPKVYSEENDTISIRWPIVPDPNSLKPVTVRNQKGDNIFSFSNHRVSINPSFEDRLQFRRTNFSFIYFTLDNLLREDAGLYSGSYSGAVIPVFILVVLGIPDTPIIEELSRPILNNNYVLNCSTKSNSAPAAHGIEMEYKWAVNCSVTDLSGRFSIDASKYVIDPLIMADNGCNVTCSAYEKRAHSHESPKHRIQISFPPKSVSILPNEITFRIEVGEKMPDFECSAYCYPECNFTWYHNNDMINKGKYLIFGDVKQSESKEYHCVAKNAFGTKFSKSVFIHIHQKVTLSMNESYHCAAGETVNLLCSVNIFEEVVSYLPWIYARNDTEFTQHLGIQAGNENILTITSCEVEDEGTYVCSIKTSFYNKSEIRSISTNLTVLGKLGPGDKATFFHTIEFYIITISTGVICSSVCGILLVRHCIKRRKRKSRSAIIRKLKLQMEMKQTNDARLERRASPEYEEIYDDAEWKESEDYYNVSDAAISDVESNQSDHTDKSSYEDLHDVNRCPAYEDVDDNVNETEHNKQGTAISSDNDSNMADDEISNSNSNDHGSSSSGSFMEDT